MVTAPTNSPTPIDAYSPTSGEGPLATLTDRVTVGLFNAVATAIFFIAILHIFATARFTALAHRIQHRHDERAQANGRPATPSVGAELLHFLGEIEVVWPTRWLAPARPRAPVLCE